LLFG
jgi:2-polyprenyl-3-methyl-5-hydroxy-6-metoxy-1,4-benzoquinol methylase